VAPSKTTLSRFDLARLSSVSPPPHEILCELLFAKHHKAVIDLRLHDAESVRDLEHRKGFFNIVRLSLMKKASFIFRETGFRSLWVLYPIVYIRGVGPEDKDGVLSPIYLWPVTLSTGANAHGTVTIALDKDAPEPVFNKALSFWISKKFDLSIDDASPGDLLQSETEKLQKRVGQIFSALNPKGLGFSGPLQAVPLKAELKHIDSPCLFNSAVIGVVQWQNQELMKDLERISKLAAEGSLHSNLIENFLTGTEFPREDDNSVPAENDRFLVCPSDYTQEKAIWRSRKTPGCVIDGPPGTGKSQTIVNIVADALARRQRILVLCQKRAALDVVAKRLHAVGLRDFFLCIHDAESDRKEAIKHIRGVRKAVASEGDHEDGKKFDSLCEKITELESKLDRYHSALFEKHPKVGLSYQDVITRIQQLKEMNPGLKPLKSLDELLKGLDVTRLTDLAKTVQTIAGYWLSVDPLRNPWMNCRDDLVLDPFVIDEITEAIAGMGALDQVHRAFVGEHGIGLAIDDPADDFMNSLNEQWGFLAEKRKLEHMVDHLLCWSKLLNAIGPENLERVHGQLKDAIEVSISASSMPVDEVLDGKLGHFGAQELGDFQTITGKSFHYRKKWWRSFSPGFATLQGKLNPLFMSLQEGFSFDVLDEILPYLQAKLTSIKKQALLSEVFGSEAENLFAIPSAELPVLLRDKKSALELYEWLKQLQGSFSWASDAWDAVQECDRNGGNQAFNNFEIGRKRGEKALPLLSDLQQLELWLTKPYVQSLRAKVVQGVSVQAELSALSQGVGTITDLLNLRQTQRHLDNVAKRVITALERQFRKESTADSTAGVTTQPSRWRDLCAMSAYLTWEKDIKNEAPALNELNPVMYQANKEDLTDQLNEKREAVVPAIRARLQQDRKRAAAHPGWRPLLKLAGPGSRRLREIVELGEPRGLFSLVPCWMMNPNTASRLFRMKESFFDVVVFDEASQCPVEQAISAIYRSKRVVVSGDEKQLPPTTFFHSAFNWEDLEADTQKKSDEAENLTDDDSIEQRMRDLSKELARGVEDLLEVSQVILPREMLKIHYRSKWPELIEFSNHAFYGGKLQAPRPARLPDNDQDAPIRLVHLPDGVYSNRTNEREAERVVQILDEIYRRPGTPPTIGVVTFNQAQTELIEQMLDEHANQNAEFRVAYDAQRQLKDGEQDVGLFVKNLENVQGDERDVMIFSTTFGRRDDGSFNRYFGPINYHGGERRLNVAITRSRLQKIIVTSLPLSEISPRVFHDSLPPGEEYSGRDYLQLYLRYAQAVSEGRKSEVDAMLVRAHTLGDIGAPPDPEPPANIFEIEVKDGIEKRLWQDADLKCMTVDSQVACRGFRIDLAVRRTDSSGYLLGIECDGRTYHESPSARFRDIWRPGILEDRGWTIHRIWSPNWWLNPGAEVEKVIHKLKMAMDKM